MHFHLNWIVFVSFRHAVGSSEALHLNLPFPARQIWLFVSSYVFEWQYVWLVSCCLKLRPSKGRKNGWVFLSAAMAAVHFSPELLSEKPVTLLMINASVRWAVSELQQTLNPDSQRASAPQPQACNLTLSFSTTNQWQPFFTQASGCFSHSCLSKKPT